MNFGRDYTEFYGQNIKQMPKLLAANKVPGSVADIAIHRIDEIDYFIQNYFDTSDLHAYDSKKRSNKMKFILTLDNKGNIAEKSREYLELIHFDNSLTDDYGIKLNEQTIPYEALTGNGIIEVSREELGKLGKPLTLKERLNNKAWRILMRHPDEVSKEFAITKKFELNGKEVDLLTKYSAWGDGKTNDIKNMAIYLDEQTNNAKLKAWYVNGLVGRSNAYGRIDLDYVSGRFVGFSGGAAGKTKLEKSLETISVAEFLEKTNATSCYAPDQIKRLQNLLEQNGYLITKK